MSPSHATEVVHPVISDNTCTHIPAYNYRSESLRSDSRGRGKVRRCSNYRQIQAFSTTLGPSPSHLDPQTFSDWQRRGLHSQKMSATRLSSSRNKGGRLPFYSPLSPPGEPLHNKSPPFPWSYQTRSALLTPQRFYPFIKSGLKHNLPMIFNKEVLRCSGMNLIGSRNTSIPKGVYPAPFFFGCSFYIVQNTLEN